MPNVSPQDISIAEQEVTQAEQEILAAEAQLQALPPDDPEYFTKEPQLRAKITAARGKYSRASQRANQLRSQFQRENPNIRQTPGQAAREADEELLRQQRRKNQAETGIPDTDRERAAREQQNAPRPPRTDSPVQIASENRQAQQLAETTRHNLETEQMARINAQRNALYQAGVLYNTMRSNVQKEAKEQFDAQMEGIKEVGQASRAMATNFLTQRGQNAEIQRARMSFVQDVLTTAMPRVAEMMNKAPKGSTAPRDFLRAFLVMANDTYRNMGLDKDLPELDPNTPYMRNLQRIAGYELPEQLPQMPTTQQISWRTAQGMAAAGSPIPGWQGPIGVPATNLPDMPRGTNGDGKNDWKEVLESPVGKAAGEAYRQATAHLPTRNPNDPTLTSEQRQQLEAASNTYRQELQNEVNKRRASVQQTSPVQVETDALRQDIRATMTSGDPNQRLRIMSIASTALDNQARGTPLSEVEQAILSNMDKEDLNSIAQNMTPEVRSILQAHSQGQKATPQQQQIVSAAVENTTNAFKTRRSRPPTVTETSPIATAQPSTVEMVSDTGKVTTREVNPATGMGINPRKYRNKINGREVDLDDYDRQWADMSMYEEVTTTMPQKIMRQYTPEEQAEIFSRPTAGTPFEQRNTPMRTEEQIRGIGQPTVYPERAWEEEPRDLTGMRMFMPPEPEPIELPEPEPPRRLFSPYPEEEDEDEDILFSRQPYQFSRNY